MGIAIVCMVKAVNTTSSGSVGEDECQASDNSSAVTSEVGGLLCSFTWLLKKSHAASRGMGDEMFLL